MVKETKRPKPTTIPIAEELGFHNQRMPEIGPGNLKPDRGRGHMPLPSEYYEYGDKFEVPHKKGIGLGERVTTQKSKKEDTGKVKWSEVI